MLVYEQGLFPCGGASTSVVHITLWGAGHPIAGRNTTNGSLVMGTCTVVADKSGHWAADLVPNSDIAPENTSYRVERTLGGSCQPIVSYITVPAEDGPYEAFTIEGDPMNSITPSALSSHAGDLSLHGGGIELAYAEITANQTVTGTGTGFGELRIITGLTIDVPDVNRPVYLEGRLHVSAPSSTITATGALGVTPSVGTTIPLLTVLDGVSTKSVPADTGVPVTLGRLIVRLPAHSAGSYSVFARAASSPYIVTIVASSLIKSWIRAIAA